jgi:hypothetical protein
MFRIADVNAPCTVLRCLLPLALFASASILHAAQPLSDQELKNRYLAYGDQENEVIVVVKNANPQPQAQIQLQPRILRLIDLENTDNLLLLQNRQDFAVGANLGFQDPSRQVLASQPAANFGSEPFSYRWGGNLDQIIEISRITGFALYGLDVELYNISGGIRFETRTF